MHSLKTPHVSPCGAHELVWWIFQFTVNILYTGSRPFGTCCAVGKRAMCEHVWTCVNNMKRTWAWNAHVLLYILGPSHWPVPTIRIWGLYLNWTQNGLPVVTLRGSPMGPLFCAIRSDCGVDVSSANSASRVPVLWQIPQCGTQGPEGPGDLSTNCLV